MNKVMLIGNVGKDPEVRYLEGNSKVARFQIATTEKYKDKEGRLRELTEWHTVTVWRGLADLVEKYVKKGTQLYVEGKLRSRTWTDRSGTERSVTEIAGDNIELLARTAAAMDGRPAGADPDGANAPEGKDLREKTEGPEIGEVDDGLPF